MPANCQNCGAVVEDAKEPASLRLDLKSRICVMAAFIYGTADHENMTPSDAVEFAAQIENHADQKVRDMKRFNPQRSRSAVRKS